MFERQSMRRWGVYKGGLDPPPHRTLKLYKIMFLIKEIIRKQKILQGFIVNYYFDTFMNVSK
jgi:hypothetical protein